MYKLIINNNINMGNMKKDDPSSVWVRFELPYALKKEIDAAKTDYRGKNNESIRQEEIIIQSIPAGLKAWRKAQGI